MAPRTAKWRLVAVAALALALVLGVVGTAQAITFIPILPPWLFYNQGISGVLTDAGTAHAVSGIVVSSYEASTGAYITSAVTDGTGHYQMWLSPGGYNVQFRDPAGRYGEAWAGFFLNTLVPNRASSTDWPVNSGTILSPQYTTINDALTQAGTIKVVARRSGHTLTLLPNIYVIAQQKDSLNNVQQWTANTNGSGAASFSGLLTGVTWPVYEESGIDPSGRSFAAAADTWHNLTAGTSTAYCDMLMAPGHEDTPTVPACKSSQKKNASFTVTGAFQDGKKPANGKHVTVLAVKGGTRKSFSATIKSGKYSAKVKLSKGTWTLYALFTGDSTFAANDSLTGKAVTTK